GEGERGQEDEVEHGEEHAGLEVADLATDALPPRPEAAQQAQHGPLQYEYSRGGANPCLIRIAAIGRGSMRSRAPTPGLFVRLLGLSAGAAPAAPGALVVQAAAEPPGLDLTATPASATAGVVFYNIQECLVKVDRHGKIVPWLAERWHTADNRNY